MKIEIRDHFYDSEKGRVIDKNDNVTGVVDKLIRLTAKITELYASDIYYDINSLLHSIKAKFKYDRILFFRENGVTSYEIEFFQDNNNGYIPENIQSWRLTHNPLTNTTVLCRVDIRKVGF